MTIKDFEEKINQSIEPYLKQEKEGAPETASFYEALGKGYSAIEKKPEAIWAYQKSISLNPWNFEAKKSLNQLQEELQVPQTSQTRPPDALFFQFFALFFVVLVLFWSRRKIRVISGILSILTLLWLGISSWFLPAYGVVVLKADLTQMPTSFAPKVSENPLSEGLLIEVLSYEKEGEWLKVKDNTGKIGFVPFNVIKMI